MSAVSDLMPRSPAGGTLGWALNIFRMESSEMFSCFDNILPKLLLVRRNTILLIALHEGESVIDGIEIRGVCRPRRQWAEVLPPDIVVPDGLLMTTIYNAL